MHRDAGAWSPTIHALLAHLGRAGFPVPEVLGFDSDGREVLRWVDGEAGRYPWPAHLRTEEGIKDLAAFLRRFHDAVAGFDPGPNPVWRIGERAIRAGEIVRHADLGPWNFLFRDGLPICLLDWDLAEPGLAIDDLAQLGWFGVPLRDSRWRRAGFGQQPNLHDRLRALCDGYGGADPVEVVDRIFKLQAIERSRIETWGRDGRYPWSRFLELGYVEEDAADLEWLERNRASIAG